MPKEMTHIGMLEGATRHQVEIRQTKHAWVSRSGVAYNKKTGWPGGTNPPVPFKY